MKEADPADETRLCRPEGYPEAWDEKHHLERADEPLIEPADVDSALEELLLSGGSLNRALLGAQGTETCGEAEGNQERWATPPACGQRGKASRA